MVDVIDYANGQKNNWRRALWNQIERHTRNKYESLIIYLPGENNLDWIEAQRRKYKRHCIIAIERDESVVKKIRADGGIAINADLHQAMLCWPKQYPVDFVIADLQCPLGQYAIQTLHAWWMNSAFKRAGILLNLQRGREAGGRFDEASGHLRQAIAAAGHDDSNNRVRMAHLNLCITLGAAMRGVSVAAIDGPYVELPPVDDAFKKAINIIDDTIDFKAFRSYKSSPRAPVMDSGIFYPTPARKTHFETRDWPSARDDVKRLISAAMAVRTAKMTSDGKQRMSTHEMAGHQ